MKKFLSVLLTVLLLAAMLALIMIFYTGHGSFVYEG